MSQADVNDSKWITPATSMRSLFALDGAEFVECAYLTILDRAPEEKGISHYVEQLRNGKSKIDVIRALYGSEEARRNQKKITWLRWGLFKARISAFSVLRLADAAFCRSSERQSQLLARIAGLEQRINAMTLEAESREQADSAASAKPQDERSELADINRDEKPDFTGKSLITKRIYAEFATAIAQRNQRRSAGVRRDG